MTHSALLSVLIDLIAAFEADRSTAWKRKKTRDRAIGLELQDLRGKPAGQLHGWLDKVAIPGFRRSGHQGTQLYHVLGLILVVAGLAGGWGLARTVLHYDGSQPINVVNALALLVLPQILLLLLWALAMAPARIPLLSGLQSALRLLNPGRLAKPLARLFPAQARTSLGTLWNGEHLSALAPVSKWLFSFWSQLFAVSFNLGILAAALYLVSFSDLAFAWSTTLELEAADFHRFLSLLSRPWRGFLPAAVPSLELVESSRFFRFDEGTLASGGAPGANPAFLGDWWLFLVAAVACYGLLPRLVTLTLSWLRLRHHLGQALARLPDSAELLARMNTPLVSTTATEPEPSRLPGHAGERTLPVVTHRRLRCPVVDWSGAAGALPDIESELKLAGIEATGFHAAGGARTTTEDDTVLASLCDRGNDAIGVLVKSWEPPLLEFLDFLRGLRSRCGQSAAIVVLLRGDRHGVAPGDLETWRITLRRLGDPGLQVEPLAGRVA